MVIRFLHYMPTTSLRLLLWAFAVYLSLGGEWNAAAAMQVTPPNCGTCVGGICWSATQYVITSPPTNGFPIAEPMVYNPDGTFEMPNWSVVQRYENGQWCYYYVDAICRWVRLLNCHGRPLYVMEVIGTRELLEGCHPLPSSSLLFENPDPPGPDGPPVAPPSPSTGETWNCHSVATGGLRPPVPTPSLPGTLPPPRAGGTPYTPKPPTTGEFGFWDSTAASIVKNNCWVEMDCGTGDPPAGAAVVLWEAPKNSDGSRNTAKAWPKHSAKSKGGGQYESKNGTRPVKDPATKQQAFGEYVRNDSAAETYYRCYAYICD